MAGRHSAGARYVGRHRTHERPRRGMASLAAVTVLTASAGGVAWWADHQPAPPRIAAQSVSRTPLGSTDPTNAASVKQQSKRPEKRSNSNKKRHVQTDALVVSTAGHRTWITVSAANGHTVLSRMLEPHHTIRLDRHHLRLTLGSAGAVALAIDGHPIAHVGRIGEVAHFSIR